MIDRNGNELEVGDIVYYFVGGRAELRSSKTFTVSTVQKVEQRAKIKYEDDDEFPDWFYPKELRKLEPEELI